LFALCVKAKTDYTVVAIKVNITHTHTQPFYGSVEFVRDNPGEPVPEETFTHNNLIIYRIYQKTTAELQVISIRLAPKFTA